MLISKGAVAGSRTAARLLRAARAGPLHLQRKLIRPTHSNSQLRKKAIAAATPGSRSDNSDRASSKTYDVPVASESIDIYTFLSKVLGGSDNPAGDSCSFCLHMPAKQLLSRATLPKILTRY